MGWIKQKSIKSPTADPESLHRFVSVLRAMVTRCSCGPMSHSREASSSNLDLAPHEPLRCIQILQASLWVCVVTQLGPCSLAGVLARQLLATNIRTASFPNAHVCSSLQLGLSLHTVSVFSLQWVGFPILSCVSKRIHFQANISSYKNESTWVFNPSFFQCPLFFEHYFSLDVVLGPEESKIPTCVVAPHERCS